MIIYISDNKTLLETGTEFPKYADYQYQRVNITVRK